MPGKFRLTWALTTYFEVEIAADSAAEAERLFEASLKDHPELSRRVGKPIHRVVEIAAAQEETPARIEDAAA